MKLFDEYPYLENENIAIHRLGPGDAEGLAQLASDPRVTPYVPTFLYEQKYEDKALVIEREKEEYFDTKEGILLGIYLKGDGSSAGAEASCEAGGAAETFVGLAEIYGYEEYRLKVSIGDRILPAYWGRGISTQVAALLLDYLIDDLGMRTVTAHILRVNEKSAHCALRNGFVRKYTSIYEDWGWDEPCLTDKYIYKKYFRYEEQKMKVLILNGSPRKGGNTESGINEMVKIFEAADIETEVMQVGNRDIRGCQACNACAKLGRCVFDDVVNEVAEKFREADGLVLASPVYYASANGTLVSLLDRLFYSANFSKTMKVGAAFAVARRGGCSATYDELNKYFGISGMPIATSQYWNSLHGAAKGECAEDAEGLQTLRTLARNMVFLMKSIAIGKAQYGLPEREPGVATNFVR